MTCSAQLLAASGPSSRLTSVIRLNCGSPRMAGQPPRLGAGPSTAAETGRQRQNRSGPNQHKMEPACKYCKKVFPTTSSRNRHEREVHLQTLDDIILDIDELKKLKRKKSKKRLPSATSVKCNYCDKYYSSIQNRKRHEETIHGIPQFISHTSVVCYKCTSRFVSLSKFREHLQEAHQIGTAQVEYDFPSEKEFQEWKERLEMDMGVKYTLRCGATKTPHGSRQTYHCQRSGMKRTAARESSKENQHGSKSQGTCKIGYFCTSSINVLRNDGRIQVTYFVDHHGHNLDVASLVHMKLPKREDKISGKNMGLEINNEDMEELLEYHKYELSMDELEQLQKQQPKAFVEEKSSEEEEGREDVPSPLIQEICAKWCEVQSFVERYHPDKAVAIHSIKIFNDNAMSHFRNIIKDRLKQITLDKYLVRQSTSESQAESSGAKRKRRSPRKTVT